MGSEDLFHQRKVKSTEKLKRSKAKRSTYEKVLIVCEGEKTESNYFKEFVEFYKLNTANVDIDGSCGSSPDRVFKRAIELWKCEDKKGDPYDKVYCVFDKDSHASYEDTRRLISCKKPLNTFYAIFSVPCFEYWLLLHFKYTTRPYAAKGNSSIADEVQKDLKAEFPQFDKGGKNIFSLLIDKLETAKNNARKSLSCAEKNKTDNPSTNVHELVEHLQNLKGSSLS